MVWFLFIYMTLLIFTYIFLASNKFIVLTHKRVVCLIICIFINRLYKPEFKKKMYLQF